ncbi:hypothetical protein GCM10022232_58810 [Streptomyces plumbiresistens]|uniref:Uncharacterized protein n=1 Tax=Streptomyces plumbiresistens TaxID=511811 RepID=A0ABP7SD96_9ACTN
MPGIPPDAPVRLDAQVFLDVHPAHPTAVVARLTGRHSRTAQALVAVGTYRDTTPAPGTARPYVPDPHPRPGGTRHSLTEQGMATQRD